MGFDRRSKPREVVASFENGYHSAATRSCGKIEKQPGEIREILVCKPELPERVADARIEAGGNQKELRTEILQGGEKPVAEGSQNFLPTRAGGEGAIDREPGTFSFSCFGSVPGPRVPRPLMSGEKKDRAVRVENLLSPVAVVDVPVNDCHALQPMLPLSVARRDRNIVEDTKSHRCGRTRVMTRRPHRTEGILHMSDKHGIHGFNNPARCMQSYFTGSLANAYIAARQFGFSGLDELENIFNVLGIVAQSNLVETCLSGAQND